MAMKKIPTAEQSLLCSSVYINNFKRGIEELVYNSLDAASSSIAIRVCFQENLIQVLDNGNGILKDNFSLLGQKYATSKYVDIKTLKSAPDKYGYRGLSLANIIDVAQCVKITSRHENSNDTWMKSLYNGKEKEICKTVSRPSKGTTVEIKGFLYNLNIQRKSIDSQNELQNIKIALQQLSLVHFNVSISLRDDSKNVIILQIHKNRDIHDTMRFIFQINEKDFQELQVEKNEYKVIAFIGKNTTEPNNDYRWIYVNGKFIHKSNIHRKLNDGLSKFLNTRNNKTKNTHVNEDDYYFNSNIPFYFIFMTCPNYDFDINYNSEKSLVEFKDWKEVNSLIEKLVQFYSGDLVAKKQEKNNMGNADKKSDTRAKVKGIIEKILNNKNKPQKISQLQNGVKGKILKRNRKKKRNPSVQRILNKKTDITNPCHSRGYPKFCNIKPSKEKLKQNPSNVNYRSKDLKMQGSINKAPMSKVAKIKKKKQTISTFDKNFDVKAIIKNNSRNNDREDPRLPKKKKIKKHVKTDKCINDKDLLMKKFESPTKTMKKRIKHLRQKVLRLLNRNDFKEYSSEKNPVYSFINNETQYQTITNNSTTLSMCKKTDQNLNCLVSKIGISGNNYKVKNSYDLIKAAVTSQYKITENKNTLAHYRQSYERKTNVSYNKTFIPLGTYNSHSNNVEAVKRMGYFTSETSRDNFFLHDQELFPVSSENVYKLPIYKHNGCKKISNLNYLNRYFFNQESQVHSYTIEMTDSHQIISNRSETYHSIDLNLPQSDHLTQSLYLNTYSLEGCTKSSHHNGTYTLNKTYYLEMRNASSPYHNLEEKYPSNMQEIVENESNSGDIGKENLVMQGSESDNVVIRHDNIIEPINNCEVVLHSHSNELRDFGNEFDNSFFSRRDSLTHSVYNNGVCGENLNINNKRQTTHNFESKHDEKNSNSINRLNNFKNCKDSLERKVVNLKQNIVVSKNLDQQPQQLQINSNKIHSDNIYGFQIKSRHRFIPKGMSPIAENEVKLQNEFPFSGDAVYYQDMIYKNFANDVVLNTEIFEPEVKNVKNLFSKHIEKVNGDIQKQNADLIFDSLSLTRAKVLGQVDCKFIASVLSGRSAQTDKYSEFLVLFDQHAVDERIKLENNLSDYIQGNSWKGIDIDPVSIVLNKDDYLYFINHKDKLSQFGLQWTFTSENEILFNAIPKAILGKNPRQVEIVMKAVKKLVSEQIISIKSLGGNVSLYPKSIMELVFSEACRYAIKFGDKLSKIECSNMIYSLARCKTPFQCAHGRPVMAVLMQVNNNNRTYKVNITKVKIFKRCHKPKIQL